MKTIAFVTRVHPKRPKMLKVCIDSVKAQTNDDYIHILHRDDKTENGYGRFLADQSLAKVSPINARYVMVLDDDDMLIDPNFVEIFREIANKDNPEIIFFKGIITGKGIYPRSPKLARDRKIPHRRCIASFCFAVRLDIWKRYIHEFGDKRNGDYKFISACYRNTKSHFWLDRKIAATQKGAGDGLGEHEPRVSIIIPTIKTEEEIAGLISEIKNSVVHELDLIVVSGMRSVSVNRNIGMDKARGEFIIMCDDDIEKLPYGWDRDLISALKHTGASMVGPRLLNPDGTLQKTNYKNFDLSKDYIKVNVMSGACCVFKNTMLRFDENYIGWGWEDTDFSKQLGGEFFVINKVKVTHRNEHKNPLGSKKQEAKNHTYFLKKWQGQQCI